MKRRAAIEPIIGHLKADNRMGRNHLKGEAGNRLNPILAAAAYNLRKLLAWLYFWLMGWVGESREEWILQG
ncbi:transposase [Paralysiella testudinis]|uniref:Transposase n=2 Tax=Paralysiella testudinis TaxID=2809020 RepID=A0A892ZGF7_9NEIS|nr:transposase [Paralysiella testudinis]